MKSNLFSIAAALACMATGALAQIPVPVGGVTLGFDTQPTVADGWSTWSAGGIFSAITNVAQLDGAVQAQEASAITTALTAADEFPPITNSIARWNRSQNLLQSGPTANAYTLLMATLRNNTDTQVRVMILGYAYGVYDLIPEQVPGLRVFWSTSGHAGDWHLIESLSGITNAGFLWASIDLSASPWAPGSPLYLLWADDNASQTDGSFTLDDFRVIPSDRCTVPSPAAATATVANGSVTGIQLTSYGCGYTNAPIVLIRGGGGTGAMAVTTITNGMVTGISLINGGINYTNAPRVIIASPPFMPSLDIVVSKVMVKQHVNLGHYYILESSLDLQRWDPVGTPFVAEDELIKQEFDVDITGRFFRIRELP